jgi:hypothetical protein
MSAVSITMVNDTVWCDLFIATLNHQLQAVRQFTRKGKPHSFIELRMRISVHRRENYKLFGIRRHQKEIDGWQAIREKYGKESDGE